METWFKHNWSIPPLPSLTHSWPPSKNVILQSGVQPFPNCKCDKSPKWDIRLDTILPLGMSNYEIEWQWIKKNKFWLELQGAKRPIDSSSRKHERAHFPYDAIVHSLIWFLYPNIFLTIKLVFGKKKSVESVFVEIYFW